MTAIKKSFGQLQGPFSTDINILQNIIPQNSQNYISKLGIHYVGNYDLDLQGNRDGKQLFVTINDNNSFQIGKTRMLEFQDIKITSIKFNQDMNESVFVDYLYVEQE